MKHGGGCIMLCVCFSAGGTGALHKIECIMRQENYVDILNQHLKTSVRKLKLGRKWVFHMENDHVRGRRPTNLTWLYLLCQEEWAKIHPAYCGTLVEGYLKCLTQVKQFTGNATTY